MIPASRQDLKTLALQNLGAPVINLELSDFQVENQVDQALLFFKEWHSDGTDRAYLRHKVTATVVTIPDSTKFTLNGVLNTPRGGICNITAILSPTTIQIVSQSPDVPLVGDLLKDMSTGNTAIASAVVLGDIDNGFFSVPDTIESVVKVFPITTSIYGSGIFDIRYQMRLNDLFDMYSTEMIYYTNVMQHLDLIDFTLVVNKQFRYNRYSNIVYIDQNWATALNPGDTIVLEVFAATDPTVYFRMYGDRMLGRLATAYVKKQWGNNTKKFNNVQILGGMTMNGQTIYEEAIEEIKELEQEIKDTYQRPPQMVIG